MTKWRLLRIIRARPRLFIGYGVGLLSLAPLMAVPQLATRCVLAWDIGSLVYLALSAALFFGSEDRDISRDAMAQQEGEWSVFALTLIGAGMSFIAIFLFSGASGHKTKQAFYLAFVVGTLALSWLTTHVTFAYRYAHEYYAREPGSTKPEEVERGIAFPSDDKPDYMDFVYFAFVLGMTFQVSDCNITSKKMRRLAILQGLIGFLFNTVILALSVNIAASLL
jgi:uncharacterized membrane protein